MKDSGLSPSRQRLFFGFLAFVGLGLFACRAPAFLEHGPKRRAAEGALYGQTWGERALTAAYSPARIWLKSKEPGGLYQKHLKVLKMEKLPNGRHEVLLEGDDAATYKLTYEIASKDELPLSLGESLYWTLPLAEDGEGKYLLLREEDERLRAVLVAKGLDAELASSLGALQPELIQEEEYLVYGEWKVSASCTYYHESFMVSPHEGIRLLPGSRSAVFLLGSVGDLRLGSKEDQDSLPYEWLLFSAAKETSAIESEECKSASTFSWALWRR